MAITREFFKNSLVPGLNKKLGEGYKYFSGDNQHLAIYGAARKSTRAYEEGLMSAELGLAQLKAEGQGMYLDEGAQEMYKARVDMKTFAIRFSISKEAIDDNVYENPAKALARSMGKSLAERKQYEAVAVLNNYSSSSYLGGDGKALGVSDHPTKDGGTNSNVMTAADFNEGPLEDMLLQTQDWVNQRGHKMNATVTKLILPKLYTFLAARLEKSMGRIGTTDNDANVHKGFAFVSGGYSINNYLSDADTWFGITNVPDGLVFFQRQNVESVSDMNFETQNMQYGATERYGFGWFDPLGVIVCPGA